MSTSPIQYPEPPPELSGKFNWRLFKYFGAGAIIASVTIGSGETVFASRGGAIFGYSLLWCFLGGTIMKGIQVYTSARHFTLTGEHPMQHWGRLPGPRNWVPIMIGVLSLICFPFWLGGLPLMLGTMINWIFGLGNDDPERLAVLARIWGTFAILVAVSLTWVQSYNMLEKVQTTIVGLLLFSLLAACLATRPDWISALLGSIIPTVPVYEDWIVSDPKFSAIAARPPWVELAVYIGAIGGGSYDYIGYIGFLREKKWGAMGLASQDGTVEISTDANNIARARKWLIAPKVDTGISFACVFIFTLCFVVLAAAVLHPKHLVPDGHELLSHQAMFLTRFHKSFVYIYQVGIFMAFWGTIYGAYELYTRTAYECLRPLLKPGREVSIRTVRRAMLLYIGLGGMVLMWTVENPIKLVTPAAIVGGVFTCGLWCFAMIWSDRHFLPPVLRMRPFLTAVTAISGVVLTGIGLKGIWDYVANFF